MKIAQVNKFFYYKGGADRVCLDEVQMLEAAGHEVSHFSMKHEKNLPSPYEQFFIEHIDFTKEKSVKKAAHYIWSEEARKKMTAFLQEAQPDVIHMHNIAHQLTPSILWAARKAGVPVVQTLHDYKLICPNYRLYTKGSVCEQCKYKKYWNAVANKCAQDSTASSVIAAAEMMAHKWVLRSYERGIKKYIAPSQFMRDKVIEWGIPEDSVIYIPNAIETPEKDDSMQRKKQVVFVSRLVKEKGIHVVLDAAAQLQEGKIIVIGDGPDKENMENRIKKEGIENVEMMGFQNHETIYRVMQESQAVIMPSLWYENAPMVVQEAFALGVPMLVSRIGGLPELVEEGVNGYIHEPGDAEGLAKNIEMCYSNPLMDLPPSPFTAEAHVQALEALYTSVLR